MADIATTVTLEVFDPSDRDAKSSFIEFEATNMPEDSQPEGRPYRGYALMRAGNDSYLVNIAALYAVAAQLNAFDTWSAKAW
jgi:hypothetical protein